MGAKGVLRWYLGILTDAAVRPVDIEQQGQGLQGLQSIFVRVCSAIALTSADGKIPEAMRQCQPRALVSGDREGDEWWT